MLGLVIGASLIIGFVVASGLIGRETRRLSRQPRQPVWRLDEAASFVESELPFDEAATTDPETLRSLLRLHLNELQFKSSDDQERGFSDPSQATQNLYREARASKIEVTLPTVEAIAAAHLRYLKRIGALGTTQTQG